MKHFRNLKRYHFLFAIAASTLFLSLLGYAGKNSVYADYSIDLLKEPQLAVVFEGIKDGNFPWNTKADKQLSESEGGIKQPPEFGKPGDVANSNNGNDDEKTNTIDNSNIDKPGNGKVPEKGNNNPSKGQNTPDNKPVKGSSNETSGTSKNTDNTKGTTETTVPGKDVNTVKDNSTEENNSTVENSSTDATADFEYETVDKSYFKDALFIGDSRTVGLSEYSGWTEPTYFADVGLTIYDIFEKEIAEVKGKKLTVDKALAKHKYGKIYIMLGINELGTGTTKTFVAEYTKVIEKIQKLQPDSLIYVEGIMNVSKKKSDSDPIFNNKNIKDRNKGIATLADNKTIFYIDVNEAITDKTGGIPEKYTFDSIHLKAAYYEIWTEFLLNHGVVK